VILIIVDKITKWGYFILYTKKITAKDITKIYIKEVFLRHKSLKKIISDRDPRFITAF